MRPETPPTGPLALEPQLVAELREALAAPGRDLARPLRVVVPSRVLGDALACALAAEAGSCLGVVVQTLEGLARGVLDRIDAPRWPELLYGVHVRERARREPALAEALDGLDDGHAAVVASVDDLLDAGFTAAHCDALDERLAESFSGPLRARSAALLRVAADVWQALVAGEVGHRSDVLARTTEALRADPQRALPTHALWIHGFADATGVQLDLLEALVAGFDARVWLDRPGGEHGSFGARLRERIATPDVTASAKPVAPPEVVRSAHRDPEDEARAAAAWARARIDAGIAPERIAIVARNFSRHRHSLRRQLERHGVPFSGAGERGGATLATQRVGALVELLERGGELPAERWLDAWATPAGLRARADLHHRVHRGGLLTLRDLAECSDPQTKKKLVRSIETAQRTLAHLDAEPERAALAGHVERLGALRRLLGWDDATPGASELDAAFPEPERAGALAVPRRDWPRLLRSRLEHAGTDAFGGAGGGVQVLRVMEARGRRFDALRVVGLNRGLFPRAIVEDPLLPDAVRRPLRDVLPDLPVKGEGHAEERHLFAQLLASAPHVHLSCAEHGVDGRASPPSPLFDRTDAGDAPPEPPVARAPHAALLARALDGADGEVDTELPAALAAGRAALGLRPSPEAAAGLLATLRELESPHARRREIGPYLGSVGPALSDADPRAKPPSVTMLEAVARCPWQGFLRRVLRLEPPPDARAALPSARDGRLLGIAVHAALETLCDPANGHDWPAAEPPEAVLLQAASKAMQEVALALPGYARALARRTAAHVEVARRLDLVDPVRVDAVEHSTTVEWRDASGRTRTIRFKADRVETGPDGPRITDWKTGSPKPEATRPDKRHEKIGEHIARGDLLQAHTYALAGGSGRFVFVSPEHEIDDPLRVVSAEADDAHREAFDQVLGRIFTALEAGAFPPRLRKPEQDEVPRFCSDCDVKAACLRGDTGARARLSEWSERSPGATSFDAAALALWHLPKAGS